MATTLLIVDDHPEFRDFAAALLTRAGFEVAGAVADGGAALAAAGALRPDVVVLDVQLPGMDGFEVARRLAQAPGAPEVVLISSRDAADYGRRLRQAPVRGFIPKDELSGAALAELL